MKITTKANEETGLFLTLLLTIVLVSGILTPFTYAENNINKEIIRTARGDLKDTALNKLDSKVLSAFDTEDYIEVLIYLKDQVDTESVAGITGNSISLKTTPYGTKLQVRRSVVEALQDKSEKTQTNLLRYIEQEKKRGNVGAYESFYITNMVYIKATKNVIENIAYMPEVGRIYKNGFIKLEEPARNGEDAETVAVGPEWNIERVGANQVWDMGIDGTGATVGIIDTGATWDHPALKEKWRGYDPITGNINSEGNWYDAVTNTPMPRDESQFPQGTRVLGTILGQEPDGGNKIGVAPGAKWIAAKAFTSYGSWDHYIISAGQWMLAPGGDPDKAPDIINNSWCRGSELDDWFRDVVKNWKAAGIVPIFAAGDAEGLNPVPESGSVENPANYPESFAVAAVDKNNKKADFSKVGPSPYDRNLIKPEITAPGVNIRSSVPGGYESGWNGTGMAAPHIAGTAALLVSANGSLGAEDIKQIIKDTAIKLTDDTYPDSPNFGYGYGLVDAFQAVASQTIGTGLITGRVLIEGKDAENPVIFHEQEAKEAYTDSDIKITANISDDISILDAQLLVGAEGKPDWRSVAMNRISGDHKNGIYTGTITCDMLGEPRTVYRIMAEDYNGNIVVTEDYYIDIKFGIMPGKYETDFETRPVGWKFTGDWEWGVPEEGTGPRPYGGTKLVGTVLGGQYSNDSDSLLITPPIDLRDETLESATLRFYQWYEIEEYDKGRIYISDDYCESRTQVGQEYNGNAKEWHEILIDLEDYIGSQTPVYIIYHFASDWSGQEDGWYIDNVRLFGKDEEPPAIPTGLNVRATVSGIKLFWEPSQEADLGRYTIYRASEIRGIKGEYIRLQDSLSNCFMDKTVEVGVTYHYVITATDLSGNESEKSKEVSIIAPNVVTIFSTDFEDNDGGFMKGVVQPNSPNYWEWGEPTSGPKAPLTGTKVWATNLSGHYGPNSRGYIASPPIVIPENVKATLAFDHWINSEQHYIGTILDYGIVEVSEDDGETWTEITGRIGGGETEWGRLEVDLAGYSGKTIKIRFYFFSDSSTQYEGWYIDNVLVAGIETIDADKTLIAKSVVQETCTEKIKGDKSVKEGYTGGIPADAVVTVLETGRSVRTNPVTGEFSMRHAANKQGEMWTLCIESHGYQSQEERIYLEDKGIINQDFKLGAISQGAITGHVFDRSSGVPVAGAVVRIKENPGTTPAETNTEGDFTIGGVYEGKYLLEVKADGFEPAVTEVVVIGNQINEVRIPLKRFVGYKDEIGYDDGTAEDGLVLTEPGDGVAVRITPTGKGKVKAANIFFCGYDWPDPGGDEISIAILDTEKKRQPGNMIGKPKPVIINRGGWNLIDLSEYEYTTGQDFFIATIQTKSADESPAIGVDEYCREPGRSYLHMNGEFIPIEDAEDFVSGGFMIRGIMEYIVGLPRITNLGDINYINNDKISVQGTVEVDGKVNIYVNDEKITDTISENKVFMAEIDLPAYENIITATIEIDGKETEPSISVKVIRDKTVPVIEITKPSDGEKVNSEAVWVEGKIIEDNFDKLFINNEETGVDEAGNFSERIIVFEGENTIVIRATDLAGNEKIEKIKVTVKLKGADLINIQPARDIVLKAGDMLKVSFNTETGGRGGFRTVPGTVSDIAITDGTDLWIPVKEIADNPGFYEGTWAIPEGFTVTNWLIEIEFIDAVGNKTVTIAPGKVTIAPSIQTEPMEKLPPKTVIIGDEAFDIRYLNCNAEVQGKLIKRYEQQEKIYIKLNKDVTVDIKGVVQALDSLPNRLTYIDADANIVVYIR